MRFTAILKNKQIDTNFFKKSEFFKSNRGSRETIIYYFIGGKSVEIKNTEKDSFTNKLNKPDKVAETNKFKEKLDNYCKEKDGYKGLLKSKKAENFGDTDKLNKLDKVAETNKFKEKLDNYCKEKDSCEGLKGKKAENNDITSKPDKLKKDHDIASDKDPKSRMRERQKEVEASLAERWLDDLKKRAGEGDNRAKRILPDWEKSVKEGKLGPAARGKTAYEGKENWIFVTRKSILEDARSEKSKLPNHIVGWYKQQENKITNELKSRAQKGDTRAKNILGDKDRLDGYLVRRMREPSGYQLGHQLGDKLGDKPGRLELSGDNSNRGRRFRL